MRRTGGASFEKLFGKVILGADALGGAGFLGWAERETNYYSGTGADRLTLKSVETLIPTKETEQQNTSIYLKILPAQVECVARFWSSGFPQYSH